MTQFSFTVIDLAALHDLDEPAERARSDARAAASHVSGAGPSRRASATTALPHWHLSEIISLNNFSLSG